MGGVIDEQDLGACIFDDVCDLSGQRGGIDGDEDGADHERAEFEQRPLHAGPRQETDAIAGRDTEPEQSGAVALRGQEPGAPGEGPPGDVLFVMERGARAMVLDSLLEERDETRAGHSLGASAAGSAEAASRSAS